MQEDVDKEREQAAHKVCKSLQSPFKDLLGGRIVWILYFTHLYTNFCVPFLGASGNWGHLRASILEGAKRVWLQRYRDMGKVRKTIAKFKRCISVIFSDIDWHVPLLNMQCCIALHCYDSLWRPRQISRGWLHACVQPGAKSLQKTSCAELDASSIEVWMYVSFGSRRRRSRESA